MPATGCKPNEELASTSNLLERAPLSDSDAVLRNTQQRSLSETLAARDRWSQECESRPERGSGQFVEHSLEDILGQQATFRVESHTITPKDLRAAGDVFMELLRHDHAKRTASSNAANANPAIQDDEISGSDEAGEEEECEEDGQGD